MDTADGDWEPVVQRLALGVPTTISQMELAFNIHIAPLGSAVATRTKHWRSWRTVLTWAAGRQSLGNILPMSPAVMRALLWESITIGASKSVLKAMLDAILSRHRDAGLPSPLRGSLET